MVADAERYWRDVRCQSSSTLLVSQSWIFRPLLKALVLYVVLTTLYRIQHPVVVSISAKASPMVRRNASMTTTTAVNASALAATKHESETMGATSTTGSLFSGKPFRSFDGARRFENWQPSLLKNSSTTKEHPVYSVTRETPSCIKWAVVTTIFAPSEAVRRAAALTANSDWCLVIVADTQTPTDYLQQAGMDGDDHRARIHFLSVEDQESWMNNDKSAVAAFVRAVPWRQFGRKNIGYLYAIQHGAEFVFDFDDDNILEYADDGSTVRDPLPSQEDLQPVRIPLSAQNAFNHHPLMGLDGSWARGLPLAAIQDESTQGPLAYEENDVEIQKIGVFQYCVNENPDIDAIHRLTKPLPLRFASGASPLVVPPRTYAPYNAQATVHAAPALFAALLPVTVPGRVSDIWRSYFAQALLHGVDLAVAFVPPRVVQERNEHSYLADMRAELDLYFKAGALVNFLSRWESSGGSDTVPARMEELWIALYERGYIERDDVTLLQLWLSALTELRYEFPPIVRKRISNVVLMGQFNYAVPADKVVFWQQNWRQVFPNIVVRGPFNDTEIAELKHRGIAAASSADDKGFYSPMQNLAETLLEFKDEASIDGVLYIHDDAMLNISSILDDSGRFPIDSIVASAHSSWPFGFADPRTVAADADELKKYSFKVLPDGWRTGNKRRWYGWKNSLPGFTKIATAEGEIYQRFLEPDGSFLVPSPTQADFLYVPTKYADLFIEAANVMVQHKIWVENGIGAIVDFVRRHADASVETINLCTSWFKIRGHDEMFAACAGKSDRVYGIYHPFKLSGGFRWWKNLFQKVTFG